MSEAQDKLDDGEQAAFAKARMLGVNSQLLLRVTDKMKEEFGRSEGQLYLLRAVRFLEGFELYLEDRFYESQSIPRQLNEFLGGIFRKIKNEAHGPLQKLALLLDYFDNVAEFDGRFMPRRPAPMADQNRSPAHSKRLHRHEKFLDL